MKKPSVDLFIFTIVLLLVAPGCNAGNIGSLFATQTPTPTNTPTATPTASPTLTATQTPLPTATPNPSPTAGPDGVELTQNSDGTTLLVDLDNGFQITLPKNWYPILFTQAEALQSPEGTSQKYPALNGMVESLKDLDPKVFRLVSVETEKIYLQGPFPTFMTVMVVSGINPVMRAMGMAAMTAWVEDYPLADAEKIAWDVKTNAHGIDVGINDAYEKVGTEKVDMRTRIFSFLAGDKFIMLEVRTPRNFGDALFKQMETMIDTIQLIFP